MLAVILSMVAAAASSPELAAAKGRCVRPAGSQPAGLTPAANVQACRPGESRKATCHCHRDLVALESNPDPDIRSEARYRHAKQLLGEKRNLDAALLLRRILDDKPSTQHAAPRTGANPRQAGRQGRRASRIARGTVGRPAAGCGAAGRPLFRGVARRPSGPARSRRNRARARQQHQPRHPLGHARERFRDFDIDKESKAKSGLGCRCAARAFRRFGSAATSSLLVRLSGSGDLYGKTRFNDIAADLAAGPELRLGRNQLNLEVGATQRWFGQKPFMRSLRAAATWTRPLGSRTQLRLSASAALVDNQLNQVQDGKVLRGKDRHRARAFAGHRGWPQSQRLREASGIRAIRPPAGGQALSRGTISDG